MAEEHLEDDVALGVEGAEHEQRCRLSICWGHQVGVGEKIGDWRLEIRDWRLEIGDWSVGLKRR